MKIVQQFQQDSVPSKIRANRGCATHPRSIAERQTNTADMLDLAVEYIKDLQEQLNVYTHGQTGEVHVFE
ncbi:unnamed protein product [Camellia sinensis]